jgi:hypothetical protein
MIGLLSLLALLMAACGASPAAPAATPDSIATRVAEELAVAATLTAKAPQPTATPSAAAAAPTAPASPTASPQPARANTVAPTATSAPASPPQQAPPPTATRPLPTQTPTTRPNPVAIVVLPVDGGDLDDPIIRNGRNVKNGQNIILPGFAPNEVSSPMIFRDRIVFRVEVFDKNTPGPHTDGAGIQNVKFVITGPKKKNGEVEGVHKRTENTAGYCAFGGGEPNCDVWVFSQRGNKWPDGKAIEDGLHSVTITITPKQGEPVVWIWQFKIERPK